MKNPTRLLLILLAAVPAAAIAGSPGGTQAHVEGNVALVDLEGGPPITDSFSLDGPPESLPLAGDAFADSILPSTATVQAVAEADALSIASETNNLTGVEPASTSATATLAREIEAGPWLLTVTTEHVAVLAGADLSVEAEIAYSVTSAAGVLVDESVLFSGAGDDFDMVEHGFSVADGDTATLAARLAVDTASPVFGNALALSVAAFELTAAADSDGDGLLDSQDNCTMVSNPGQEDNDDDGIGNLCDADLNNDCMVDFNDMAIIRLVFFTDDANADLNGDGRVNFGDLVIMKDSFFGPPGPSGVPNVCD